MRADPEAPAVSEEVRAMIDAADKAHAWHLVTACSDIDGGACETCIARALRTIRDRAYAAGEQAGRERAERECLWLHHGHDGLYGDDGEMQCCSPSHGPLDFKRMALPMLYARVAAIRHPREESDGSK